MKFNSALRNFVLVLFSTLLISACSTAKKAKVDTTDDVYTGTDTIEFLAKGVPDRVFFATNKSKLTTRSRDTLRKQATFLRKNKDVTVTVEGHADERGTREYNLALGQRRAESVANYLIANGVKRNRLITKSYGEERPLSLGSNDTAWSKNRRVEIK